MKNKKYYYTLFILTVALIFATTSCKQNKTQNDTELVISEESQKEETLYRPNFHFTPKANWMNDPNGMFYLNGKYHLYFQYYPDGNVWGPMHWGHAISKDMVTWEEQPIALYPDDLGYIFSGSAVVDKNNTSGFGKDGVTPVIAIFTYHNMEGEKAGKIDFQSQAIAYSLDEGMTWAKYEENPVIPNPGIKDFRDPKVVWDETINKWIMSLAAGNKIMFYSSPNLKDWTFESEFGENLGAHGGVWECPDLFPIQVDGSDKIKWVLIVSINPGGPNGGSATQYFVGDFDGTRFILDEGFSGQLQDKNAVWLDYGRDNYAGVTWSNIPKSDGRRLFIGWMSNWDYARDVPTFKWRSSMTTARELKLKKNEYGFNLQSLPVNELFSYASKNIQKDSINSNEIEGLLNKSDINFAKLNLRFKLKDLKKEKYSLLFFNKVGDTLSLGLNNLENEFFINRQNSGEVDFSEKFASKISKVKASKNLQELKVQIVLDKTSVEVFYNEGETVMTELFFPKQPLEMFSIISNDETFSIENLNIQEFKFK
ncbi:glycoside hydrolase family 32 protein [Flaviramulus sp. BrNp1-15]|uniref:glycoside hydrolase family 32 protein n=1 Tax=Flaviramulus sp. BrNp1-15 TaxID=2916754 RepID=UPI001EE88B2F|nr:glycoside hydrolase family 32 protein [Flaviramulus sp. BrNp1-15]ULC59065.1 glycoside hydrolase family 32 protein [Flaviramulus sp. BrNp1-15]